MRPVHFYHLYLGGRWQAIASEHFDALRAAQFPGDIYVSLIGSAAAREEAKQLAAGEVVAEEDAGFEDVTLRVLQHKLAKLPGETPILYTHNKGSFHSVVGNHIWRRKMDAHLITGWQNRLNELKTHDVAAWAWAEPGNYPVWVWAGADRVRAEDMTVTYAMAPGNFWWARADYLKGLPALEVLTEKQRGDAETWLGKDNPVVAAASFDWPMISRDEWDIRIPLPSVNGMRQGYIHRWMDDNGIEWSQKHGF